jgi:hypothetical protein
VQTTNTQPQFEVTADGQGIVSHAGAVLVTTTSIHPTTQRDCMKRSQVRARRLVMRRIMAAYTNASALANNLS